MELKYKHLKKTRENALFAKDTQLESMKECLNRQIQMADEKYARQVFFDQH